LAAAKAMRVVIDDFEFSVDELEPYLNQVPTYRTWYLYSKYLMIFKNITYFCLAKIRVGSGSGEKVPDPLIC